MDSTSDITIGQVVKSKAGRDKGRIFLVLDIIDDQHILIVDGDLRKLDNPKRKDQTLNSLQYGITGSKI